MFAQSTPCTQARGASRTFAKRHGTTCSNTTFSIRRNLFEHFAECRGKEGLRTSQCEETAAPTFAGWPRGGPSTSTDQPPLQQRTRDNHSSNSSHQATETRTSGAHDRDGRVVSSQVHRNDIVGMRSCSSRLHTTAGHCTAAEASGPQHESFGSSCSDHFGSKSLNAERADMDCLSSDPIRA